MPSLLWVGFGGLIGAVLRYLCGYALRDLTPAGFPWPTLLINLTGCFFLGLLLNLPQERYPISPALKSALTTGLLGAFTTFSTFSVETVNLLRNGLLLKAGLYILLSLILGIFMAWMGIKSGKALAKKPRPEQGL